MRQPRHRGGSPPRAAAFSSEPVEVRIDALGADGDGMATRPDGSRFYIPLTLPGERVLARVVSKRGDAWLGEAKAIFDPSPERQAAVCAHFGTCGGCVTQHWDASKTLTWKVERLTTALRRAGYEDPLIAPAVLCGPHTRRRMDLAVRRVSGGVAVGLHGLRDSAIADLTECHVLHPDLFALIAPLRPLLTSLPALRHEGSIVVNLLDSGPDLLLRTDGPLITGDRVKLTDFARSHDLPRVSWAFGAGTTETVCLLRPTVTDLSGATVTPPPGAFLQATREGEAAIVAAVLAGLPAKQTAKSRVLELFAGCGTISFALAKRIRVLAIEGDESLVTACHAAASAAGLTGRVEAKRRDLTRQPFLAKEFSAFSAVVLDPPHMGAAAQMPFLAAGKVGTVIYVSCDPAALGRDAGVLHQAGYRLERVTPIDQFLWSARLEAVAVFRLGR